MKPLLLLAFLVACGGAKRPAPVTQPPALASPADRLLPLLPDGAQLVIELDLARLRSNPLVGPLVTRIAIPGAPSPDALADRIVIAAYGLGTSETATVTLVSSPRDVPGATRLPDGNWALGPPDWVAQVEARAALIATGKVLEVPRALLALRDHAVPAGAPGAALRITARLPLDARIALARLTGLSQAPAQLSVWGDVVDDAALVLDADATDPGDKAPAKAGERLASSLRRGLATLADDPAIRALGLPASLTGAKLVTQGTWVRVIVAIGPNHLKRVVERAMSQLENPPR